MVTDQQVRRLFMLTHREETLEMAAAKAGMDVKTARKYRRLRKLPSELKVTHSWLTRKDPFEAVWEEVRRELELNSGLEAKTLFGALQQKYPGRFADGQLRTLQRRLKRWRALEGSPKEVFFSQVHEPGQLCQSDFTWMGGLGITIAGQPFDHLLYHFVLSYSNWEDARVCFSESFESLSEGLQSALWALGGVPVEHQTDRLSSAVNNLPKAKGDPIDPQNDFTERYSALLRHYGLVARRIQAGKAHENGDVEQRHHRLKRALEQGLLLRGGRDFADRAEYESFLHQVLEQLNAGRRKRLAEELAVLRPLPARRRDSHQRVDVRVDSGSLIHVERNVYSVNSRLIGEKVEVRLYAEHLEVWYAQRLVERLARLRGRRKHKIAYRHIIDWLIRKPGAFENYRYRDDLFPTSRFRMAYDALKQTHGLSGNRQYLQILYLAARETEAGVDEALRHLLKEGRPITAQAVKALVGRHQQIPPVTEVTVEQVDLIGYDELVTDREVA